MAPRELDRPNVEPSGQAHPEKPSEIVSDSARSPSLPPADELRGLVRRAEEGDREALPALRSALDTMGGVDIAGHASEAVARSIVGDNVLAREMLLAAVRRVAADLAGPSPTPIERLLADRAAMCWLSVHGAELDAHRPGERDTGENQCRRRRLDSANNRYLAALKALALVRRLAVPALQMQVNVAGGPQQVNVGGGRGRRRSPG